MRRITLSLVAVISIIAATASAQYNAKSATWTSSTAADSELSISVAGYPSVWVSLTGSGTVTAGAASFELSDDAGSTWYAAVAGSGGAAAAPSTSATLSSTLKQFYYMPVGGASNFRLRLSTAISGGGSITARASAVGASTPTNTFVTVDHPRRFMCSVVNSSATALTALGGQCAAPGDGLSLYITDVNASASVISTTTADQFPELKYGTGGSCGTGTAVIWAQYGTAFGSVSSQFLTPLKVPANNELCWMHAAAGSKSFIVSGFIAP